MRIVCPSCQATYEVPEALIAGGKAVRCARCGAEWAPLLPPPAAPPPTPTPTPPPAPEEPLRAEPPLVARPRSIDTADDARPPPWNDEIEFTPRRQGALIAWLVSLLVLAALIGAALLFRSAVMGVWPPSMRLYAALGLQ